MRIFKEQCKLNYDGSFEGFLTLVYTAYELKLEVLSIEEQNLQMNLFVQDTLEIETDKDKADRVWKGIQHKYGRRECRKIYRVFLSEDKLRAIMLLKYIQRIFDSSRDWRTAYQLEEVLYVKEQLKKMRREVHRMHAFVRFQQTQDDLYFSVIEPDFDVIPFIGEHFKKRYSDQRWLIFDKQRGYGIYYNLSKMNFFSWTDQIQGSQVASILSEQELHYENWWKSYFKATNIKERKNIKLHLRHVPLRYWKYLTEKQ